MATRFVPWFLVVTLALISVLGPTAPPAFAADINVTTTDDELNADGDCSLREAIDAANVDNVVDACPAGSGADVITIPAGTYNLASQLDIFSDITLVGEGARSTIIDGGTTTRVFQMGAKGDIAVTMSGLTIQNGAATFGAGIRALLGVTLTLDGVTIDNNVAQCDGGGIMSEGILTISHSAITNNQSLCTDSGGGIMSEGQLSLTNVTLSGNFADNGGAIRNDGLAQLLNVTIYNNEAEIAVGGILNNGSMTITNTIVGASINGNCGGNGTFTSGGHNIEDEDTCGFTDPSDRVNTDPVVGPLQDNGGPTDTHGLPANSPAVDTGDDGACPSDDQRGEPRPADGDQDGAPACDIGAYELQAVPPVAPTATVGAGGATPVATPISLPSAGGGSNTAASWWLLAAFIAAAGGLAAYGALRLRTRA